MVLIARDERFKIFMALDIFLYATLFSLTRRTGKLQLFTFSECMLDGPATVNIVEILSLS